MPEPRRAQGSVERWFAVSPGRLLAAYREPRLMMRWFGPPNIAAWLHFEHDPRPGGALAFGFLTQGGEAFWGRCDFTVFDADRIVYVSSITDPSGSVIAPLADRDWLLQVYTEVTLTPHLGGVSVRVEVRPHAADADERGFFALLWPDLRARFEASFDVLGAFLAEGARETLH